MRLLALLAVLSSAPAAAQVTPASDYAVVHAGILLDRPGRAPRRIADAIVRGVLIEGTK